MILVVTILCRPAATYEGEAVIQLVPTIIHPIAVALAPPGSGLGTSRKLHFAPAATVRAVNTATPPTGFRVQAASREPRTTSASEPPEPNARAKALNHATKSGLLVEALIVA